MKLQTHEYSVNYLSVVLPEHLVTQEIIHDLQNHATDECARLKDGIEVPADNLGEIEINVEDNYDDVLVQFASYLLNNWPHVDTFIFTP